jgi:hypothetical protein
LTDWINVSASPGDGSGDKLRDGGIKINDLLYPVVISRTLSIPPASPGVGDKYIPAAGASGAWDGRAGWLASFWDGEWRFYAPRDGMFVRIADEAVSSLYSADDESWLDYDLAEMTALLTTLQGIYAGAVKSINGALPDGSGEVILGAADVGAANAGQLAELADEIGHQVRFDAEQILTSGEQAQARSNIGAASAAAVAALVSGKIAQVVVASLTTSGSTTAIIPNDSTKPQSTEGAQFLTASITPTSASHTLLYFLVVPTIGGGASNVTFTLAVFRDSGADAIAAQLLMNAYSQGTQTGLVVGSVAAGSTTATTFKARYGTYNATYPCYLLRPSSGDMLGGTITAQLIIMEVAP